MHLLLKWGYLQIIHLNNILHYNHPAIGVPPFMEPLPHMCQDARRGVLRDESDGEVSEPQDFRIGW